MSLCEVCCIKNQLFRYRHFTSLLLGYDDTFRYMNFHDWHPSHGFICDLITESCLPTFRTRTFGEFSEPLCRSVQGEIIVKKGTRGIVRWALFFRGNLCFLCVTFPQRLTLPSVWFPIYPGLSRKLIDSKVLFRSKVMIYLFSGGVHEIILNFMKL